MQPGACTSRKEVTRAGTDKPVIYVKSPMQDTRVFYYVQH